MHDWSQKDVDWKGINDAAGYIGMTLLEHKINVSQWKEKFGTVRVYCDFGWYSLHSITHPGYAWTQYRADTLMYHLNCSRVICKIISLLNVLVVPYQKHIYRHTYKQALRKWPHLAAEIILGADHTELLVGLDDRLIYDQDNNSTTIGWRGLTDVNTETEDGRQV